MGPRELGAAGSETGNPASGEPLLQLSPERRLVATHSGTAALHEEILMRLDQTGLPFAEAVPAPPPLPFEHLDPNEPEYLLLELDRGGTARRHWLVGALEITPLLFQLLKHARDPRSPRALELEAAELGAAEGAREVLRGLLEEGILVAVHAR
jgi:hypothetical protein